MRRKQSPPGACFAHTGLTNCVAGMARRRRRILPLPRGEGRGEGKENVAHPTRPWIEDKIMSHEEARKAESCRAFLRPASSRHIGRDPSRFDRDSSPVAVVAGGGAGPHPFVFHQARPPPRVFVPSR